MNRFKARVNSESALRLINALLCEVKLRGLKSMKVHCNSSFINPTYSSNTAVSATKSDVDKLKDVIATAPRAMKDSSVAHAEVSSQLSAKLSSMVPGSIEVIASFSKFENLIPGAEGSLLSGSMRSQA